MYLLITHMKSQKNHLSYNKMLFIITQPNGDVLFVVMPKKNYYVHPCSNQGHIWNCITLPLIYNPICPLLLLLNLALSSGVFILWQSLDICFCGTASPLRHRRIVAFFVCAKFEINIWHSKTTRLENNKYFNQHMKNSGEFPANRWRQQHNGWALCF